MGRHDRNSGGRSDRGSTSKPNSNRGSKDTRGSKDSKGRKSHGESRGHSPVRASKPEDDTRRESFRGGSGSKGRVAHGGKIKLTPKEEVKKDDGLIRLNRYIAHAGICSRREADTLITSGVISVNGKVVTELGTKVNKTDKIKYEDQTLKNEKLVYFILNKPKDFITTSDDPDKRRTVMQLMKGACKERIYPVGRLDRNTSGVLLFSNDGDLTKKLLHPKHLVKKIYHVSIDKSLKQDDFNKLSEGFQLEDGFIKADELAYTSMDTKKEIGLEIHSGKNRIVRRMFESLGYKVLRLDRALFAGLSKKGMSRGQYRELTEQEVGYLKMLG
ncbi:MAG: 23S rRNA pseudouridine2605 synthase [Glaciecola sp.]|jgi:23S rRNA pseudouridine2605 synthase